MYCGAGVQNQVTAAFGLGSPQKGCKVTKKIMNNKPYYST